MSAANRSTLLLGLLAAIAGAAFLWNVGALPGMASRNLAAFLLGLVLGWTANLAAHRRHGAEILFTLATAILALVLVAGIEMDGVKRWLPLGPLNVQPALILAPLVLALAASRDGRHWRAAVLVPVALVALQPDAATMLAMATGVAAMMADASSHARRGWSPRRTAIAGGAAALAIAGLLAAGIQTPPPVAFVEGTVGIAALSGPWAMGLHVTAIGLAVAAMLAARNGEGRALAAYFAIAAGAAIFWAFPMPVAGASPSHLVGFGLSVGWLVKASPEVRNQA